MTLKKLRAALPGAEVSPDGPILERLAARITGQAKATQITVDGHTFRLDGRWHDAVEAANYVQSCLPGRAWTPHRRD